LDEALPGLGRGGRVQVRMEPARGYGAAGVPGVLPPGATVEARLTVEAVGGFLSLPT
jgi:FKBP-type peptidyl-prolyl cis-trans isomerase